MKRRSLAAGAALTAGTAALLIGATVSSASPAAPAGHANVITTDDSGYAYHCVYHYYDRGVWTGSWMAIDQNHPCDPGGYDTYTKTGWKLESN